MTEISTSTNGWDLEEVSINDDVEFTRNDLWPDIDGPDDPRRMELSPEEREDALLIKREIQKCADLDNVSDFACAHLAIIHQDNVAEALKRAHLMQQFRETYGFVDSLGDGQRQLRALLQNLPHFVLDYGYHSESSTYVATESVGGFQPSLLDTPEKIDALANGGFYYGHVLTPDFYAIRQGVAFHWDCCDIRWRETLANAHARAAWSAFHEAYPFRIERVVVWNASALLDMFLSMAQRYFPKRHLLPFQVGNRTNWNSPLIGVQEFYLQPSVQAKNQRVLQAFTRALERRYANVQAFSLDPTVLNE